MSLLPWDPASPQQKTFTTGKCGQGCGGKRPAGGNVVSWAWGWWRLLRRLKAEGLCQQQQHGYTPKGNQVHIQKTHSNTCVYTCTTDKRKDVKSGWAFNSLKDKAWYIYTQRSFYCVVCTCTVSFHCVRCTCTYRVSSNCVVCTCTSKCQSVVHIWSVQTIRWLIFRGKLSGVVTNTVSALGRQRLEDYEFEATPGLDS